MSGVIPRDHVKKQLATRLASAPGMDATGIEVRFTAALKAARLQDKPSYRPEEVAAIGQAVMAMALDEVNAGLAILDPPKAKPPEPTS